MRKEQTMTMQTIGAHAHRSPLGAGVWGQIARAHLTRCRCRGCGSHVHAVVLKQTISGLCTTCGGCDITRLTP
jgi:hypothetical protein